MQQLAEQVGRFREIAVTVVRLSQGELPLPQKHGQVRPDHGTDVAIFVGQFADVGMCLGKRLDPGTLGPGRPQSEAARSQCPLQGAEGQPAVTTGRDERDAHLTCHERAACIDAVGLGEVAQTLLRLALPVEQRTEIKGGIKILLAGLLVGRGQGDEGRVDLLPADQAQPVPERRFRARRLHGEDAFEQTQYGPGVLLLRPGRE